MMIDATGMIMDNPLVIRLIKDDSQIQLTETLPNGGLTMANSQGLHSVGGC
jgi:hypothetical protein